MNQTQRETTIFVLFEDEDVNLILSELLGSRGVTPCVISQVAELPADSKIVTEPKYFDGLNNAQRKNCLVIGNKTSLENIEALCLSRPLTEEKVERALSEFLVPAQPAE